MIEMQKLKDNSYGFKDHRYSDRWLDAFGDVQKSLVDSEYRADDFTITATGTSPISQSVVPGAVALITTENVEYAGDNIQVLGTRFKLESGKPCYFGAKLTISDATQTDLLVGLCGTDTTLTNASASHAVAVSAGGAFFSKVDGVTAGYFKTVNTATEANSIAAFTADTGARVYEFFFDGVDLAAYVDGVRIGGFHSFPTEVLTPSICFRAGEAAIKTCTIHWMRTIQALS